MKTKTYEEKSAEYIRVKNRIFNTQTTTTSNNSYDPSRMTVLNRQSENGRNGGYNQSKPIYNNKTRQNGGAYVTPRQYSNPNNNVAQFNSPLPNGNNASASNTASVATAATSTNVSMVLNMSYLQQFPVQGGQMYQTMMHPQYTSHILPQQQTNLANQPSMIYNGNGMGVSNGQQPYKLMQHLNMPPSMAPIPPVSVSTRKLNLLNQSIDDGLYYSKTMDHGLNNLWHHPLHSRVYSSAILLQHRMS